MKQQQHGNRPITSEQNNQKRDSYQLEQIFNFDGEDILEDENLNSIKSQQERSSRKFEQIKLIAKQTMQFSNSRQLPGASQELIIHIPFRVSKEANRLLIEDYNNQQDIDNQKDLNGTTDDSMPNDETSNSQLKYKGNYKVIAMIIILLSLQGISYGYMLGTWNRINYIMKVVYNFKDGEDTFYEQFINMAPTAGLLIGRLVGSIYVNHGRFWCIIVGSLIIIGGIGMQLVASIWMYIGGRFVASVGNGIFGSSSPRYIEECSPPHMLSFLFTLCSFGMSLNRPLVTVASFVLVDTNSDRQTIQNTQTWRIFLAIPGLLSLLFLVGMFTIVRHDTPVFLISKKKYNEAKKALKHFTNPNEDLKQIFKYLRRNSSKETNTVTLKQCFTDEKYQRLTIIMTVLQLSILFNSIYVITTFGTTLFEIMYQDKQSYTSTFTLNLISVIDPIANAASVFIVPIFKRRTALLFGFISAGLINIAIGVSDALEFKTGIVIFSMMLSLVVGISQDPAQNLYRTEVSNNATSGMVAIIASLVQTGFAFAIPTLVKTWPGPLRLFIINGGLTLLSALFVFICIKETAHLSDKEKKVLYAPPFYLEQIRNQIVSDYASSFGSEVNSVVETVYSKKTARTEKSRLRKIGDMASKMQNDQEAMFRRMTSM